ncbi:MAG: leucine-rich repeat domain-containing protein, partial [Muribaculaceae bacterium]|nr:leucine-rich repeat domain-containing protein [Muribaculaceae bacterium]
LGDRSFSHCNRLETVMMPESLTSFGDGIFFDCNSLTGIVMPATLTRLTPYMFKGTGISDAGQIIRDGILEIGDYALYGNSNITEATLPGSINHLGDKALSGMVSLTVLDVTGIHDLPELGEDVFEGTAGEGVRLVTTVDMAPIFKTTPQWQEFDITVDENAGTPAPGSDTIGSLRLRHDGNTLWINAPRAIDSITVSDLNGRVTAHAAVHGDTMAGISTATIPGGIAIVTVRFDNATCANIKIIL